MTSKLMIGMPVRDHIHPATNLALNHVRLALKAADVGFLFRQENRGSLPLAHSLIANTFLASEATHLLIVHADVAGFTPEDILRMVRSGKDLIGAPVPGRSFDPERVARALLAGVAPERAWLHAAPQLWWEKDGARFDDGALEVAAMSTGFLMMTRAAVEGAARFARTMMWEHEEIVHVFEEDVDGPSRRLMSEDKAFCGRCAMAGIACWADVKTALMHWGEAAFYAAPLEEKLVVRTAPGPRRIPVAVRFSLACPTTCEAEARDILSGGLYDLPLDFGARPPWILDLGANIGAFARFALARWPGSRVDCYEPQGGEVWDALQENRAAGMNLFSQAVVPDTRDEVSFLVRPFQPTGSHVDGAIEPMEGEMPIRVSACDARGLPTADVLKLDVEGREPEILARYFEGVARDKTRGIIAEWHSEAERDALRAVLESHGFSILDMRAMRPDRPQIGVVRAVRA